MGIVVSGKDLAKNLKEAEISVCEGGFSASFYIFAISRGNQYSGSKGTLSVSEPSLPRPPVPPPV